MGVNVQNLRIKQNLELLPYRNLGVLLTLTIGSILNILLNLALNLAPFLNESILELRLTE
jgi:hypothetical protein